MDARGRAGRACLGLTVAAVAGPLCLPAAVATESSSRQTITFNFASRQPARGTGLELGIDYVNPDDPSAKPWAVQTVIETLAPGTRIDTSVPERCPASDAELVASGEAACPPSSRVGGGEVDLDSGLAGPLRTVQTSVTMFNSDDELILLFEPATGAGVVRSVARSPITEGRVITSQAPPLPGGPPDGFTAIRRVRLRLEPRASYITTPPSCPPSGRWTNTIAFQYRDGVTQTAGSESPCDAPTSGTNAARAGGSAAGAPAQAQLPVTGSEDGRLTMGVMILALAALFTVRPGATRVDFARGRVRGRA